MPYSRTASRVVKDNAVVSWVYRPRRSDRLRPRVSRYRTRRERRQRGGRRPHGAISPAGTASPLLRVRRRRPRDGDRPVLVVARADDLDLLDLVALDDAVD